MNKQNSKTVITKAVRERIYPKIWDVSYILTRSNIKHFHELITILKKERSNIRVLDLGCGEKPFEKILLNHFEIVEYLGIDMVENSMADILLDLNIERIPFEEKSFDLIILSEVLEHLYNPMFILKEALRVLKKGGYIYISTPFLFHYHEPPHDYYRYTEFFYKKFALENNLLIISIKKGGTFFSSPFFALILLITAIFKKLGIKPLAYTLTSLFNIISLIIDSVTLRIFPARLKQEAQYLHAGISVIFKKN